MAMLALLASFVTSCTVATLLRNPADDAPKLPSAQVTRPGEVLFPRQERASTLAGLPGPTRASWCPDRTARDPAPIPRLTGARGRPDTASEPFALAVMTDAAAALAGDRAAQARLVRCSTAGPGPTR